MKIQKLFVMTKDKYNEKSFYRWKKFSKKELDYKGQIAHDILVDFIETNEIFYATNKFINYDNPDNDNYFRAESKLLGVKKMFTLGMITNPDHQALIEDLVYGMVEKFRKSSLSTEEKATEIVKALRAKILTLK